MTSFTATFAPHGANVDGLVPATWSIQAADRGSAIEQAMDLAGKAIGLADFAYRDLADGSVSILDTICGHAKIASLKVRAARTPAFAG